MKTTCNKRKSRNTELKKKVVIYYRKEQKMVFAKDVLQSSIQNGKRTFKSECHKRKFILKTLKECEDISPKI